MPLGRIDDGTTANIGRIEGGQQSNIVAPTARIEAEARSLSEERLAAQIDDMRTAVADAAADLGGSFDFEEHRFYVAYQLAENEPAVAAGRSRHHRVGPHAAARQHRRRQ